MSMKSQDVITQRHLRRGWYGERFEARRPCDGLAPIMAAVA